MPGTLLVCYDVESNSECTDGLLKGAGRMHEDVGVPWTIFLTGQTIEGRAAACRKAAGNPLLALAQHTYSHKLLKTVYMQPGDGRHEPARQRPLRQQRSSHRRGDLQGRRAGAEMRQGRRSPAQGRHPKHEGRPIV